MKLSKFLLLSHLFCLINCTSIKQSTIKYKPDCIIGVSKSITNVNDLNLPNNKIFVNSSINNGFIENYFFNLSNDTIFLFAGLFNNYFYKTENIKRIDTIKKIFKISFVPIIPSPRQPHHYNYFKFILLKPHSIYTLNIPLDTLFSDKSCVFEYNSNHPKDAEDAKICNDISILDSSFIRYLEFGYYRNIDLLSCHNVYSNDTRFWKDYNASKNSYEIIRTRLTGVILDSILKKR